MKKVKWLLIALIYTILVMLLLYMVTKACGVTSEEWLEPVRKAGQLV